jgi:hypothetical protein
MRITPGSLLSAWLASVVWLTSPATSAACSSFACTGVRLAPSAAVLPANLPGLFVSFGSHGTGSQVSLSLSGGSKMIALSPDHRLLEKLTPGASYTLRMVLPESDRCPAKELMAGFLAGPEAALPSTLGSAVVKAQGRGPTAVGFTGASCYSTLDTAYVELEPSLDSATSVWANTLVDVVAVVDGQPYWVSAEQQPQEDYYPTRGSGIKPLGGGDVRVRVFVACQALMPGMASSYAPLSEGKHRVKLRGTVPGIGTLETSETEIELSCGDVADAGSGAPHVADPEGDAQAVGSAIDAGDADSGRATLASAPAAPSQQAQAPAATTHAEDTEAEHVDNGCALSSGRALGRAWLAGLALLLIALMMRRLRPRAHARALVRPSASWAPWRRACVPGSGRSRSPVYDS